jgi:nitrate/TMAO reductase-like tetraheme cytochrome c subunit
MIKHFFSGITSNIVSLVGTIFVVVSTLLLVALLVMQSAGFEGSSYLGLLTFVFLPLLFIIGVGMIPFGLWWQKRRDARIAAQGGETKRHFPIIDFNKESTRGVAFGFLLLAIPVIAIVAGLSFKAVHYMDSTEFCGTVCHTVMQPEYTAFQRSPHTRVGCAGCHIGAGAEWFVKAKVSGSWQLIAVAFDLYPRPITTPVHSLRPSSGTCEQCHTPTKFIGERLRVRTHYADDETNTEMKTALMVKVGGKVGTNSHGIHWHVDKENTIRYLSDPSRENIHTIELRQADGTVKVFKAEGPPPADAEWRTMDCIDCHNRASHNYRSPGDELDAALLEGRVDRSLPYFKREGLRLLTEAKYDSHEAARAGLARDLQAFYAKNYPDLAGSPAVEQAGKALGDMYSWNIFPAMNVTWDLYPNHIGHRQSPGCFRCHDNKHKTADGDKIGKKCSTCHTIVADEETDSKLLQELGLQEPPPAPPEAAAPADAAADATAAAAEPAAKGAGA